MYNPSLREESRNQRANVVSSRQQPSILNWLESSGRMLARDAQQERDPLAEDEEIEEINELMTGEESDYLDEDEIDLEE